MSKSKSVTTAQAEQVRKMANEKGLGRKLFQDNLLDNGTMSRVLDAVKGGLLITFGIPLIPPPGGRIHILKVKTQLDQEWRTAINAAGPDTPLRAAPQTVQPEAIPDTAAADTVRSIGP